MSIIQLTFSLGQLFGLLMAAFTLTNLHYGNWKLMTLFCTIPNLVGWVISMVFMTESARYELLTGNFEGAFLII